MRENIVWVKTRGNPGSGSSIHIHTNPECHALELAHSVQRADREELPTEWPDCALCTTDPADHGGVPSGIDPQARRRHLQELDPEDLDL